MNEKVKMASELFSNGRYCSQAVLGAFCEEYGMDREIAFRVSCGLNSGARCGELCGAVSGAVLVIGLRYGDYKEICNQRTEEFMNTFKEKYGEVVCRDILGCDISTPEGKAKFIKDDLFGTICMDAVINAAQTLSDLGY
ncbi:MAG: C-GCAxxG-C-C family protein [Methanomassiliicoccaceae archaeon]|nr:C-GCAxxG-C-C family protein [Methanomassiliicoccaceae archaeon]